MFHSHGELRGLCHWVGWTREVSPDSGLGGKKRWLLRKKALPEWERRASGDFRRQAWRSEAVLGKTNGTGKGTNMIRLLVWFLLDALFAVGFSLLF